MTRQTKTPRQRAQEQLDAANRTVIRLDRKLDTAKTQLATLERDHTAALRRRDHLAQHPDLQQNPNPTTQED